jgi:ethanolamine utilization protein EutQ (cupin superfamily)
MKVRRFTITDAALERSPGQDGDVFVGNLVDQRHASRSPSGTGAMGRTRHSRRQWPSMM